MPVRITSKTKEREKELQNIISNTYGCKNCGKTISFDVSKRLYCLECSIKYGAQILEKKRKMAMELKNKKLAEKLDNAKI